jgi:hypothetical protein
MVLAIAAMVAGGAITYMVLSSDERALKDVSGDVEVMAKRARATSILQQTPYALEFRWGEVRLLPFAESGLDDMKMPSGNDIGGNRVESDEEDQPAKRAPVRAQLALPENMAISIRRWNSQSWIPLEKNTVQVWRFDPDGLCEPLAVHYALEKSWAEDAYHPLTGSVRDSQLEAR